MYTHHRSAAVVRPVVVEAKTSGAAYLTVKPADYTCREDGREMRPDTVSMDDTQGVQRHTGLQTHKYFTAWRTLSSRNRGTGPAVPQSPTLATSVVR